MFSRPRGRTSGPRAVPSAGERGLQCGTKCAMGELRRPLVLRISPIVKRRPLNPGGVFRLSGAVLRFGGSPQFLDLLPEAALAFADLGFVLGRELRPSLGAWFLSGLLYGCYGS